MKTLTRIEKIKEAVRQHNLANKDNRFNHVWSAKLWEKGDKKRIYINRTNGRNNRDAGWIDLVTLEIHDVNDWEFVEKLQEALK